MLPGISFIHKKQIIEGITKEHYGPGTWDIEMKEIVVATNLKERRL